MIFFIFHAVFSPFSYLYSVNNLDIQNKELIDECVKGNQNALGLFYSRFAPRMMSVILRYVDVQKDAEDILHDGFILAYTNLKSVTNPDSVEYWLASIMKNLCLKYLQNQDVVTLLNEIPESEDTPEFSEIIDIETLERLISRLPQGYQSVFRLSVLENKSHNEIAKILNITPHTSSSQLFHAKMMMRKFIAEYRKEAGLLVLLILCVASGIFFLHEEEDLSGEMLVATIQSGGGTISPTREIAKNPAPKENAESGKKIIAKASKAVIPIMSKTKSNENSGKSTNSEDAENSESLDHSEILEHSGESEKSESTESPESPGKSHNSDNDEITALWGKKYPAPKKPARSGNSTTWSVGISTCILANGKGNADMRNESNVGWGAYPGDVDLEHDEQADTRSAPSRYIAGSHHNDMPITFSLTMHKSFNKTLSIETGLSYTYLHTNFEAVQHRSEASWHYLGIPLNLNINNYSSGRFNLYGSLGIRMDIPVKSSAKMNTPGIVNYIPNGKFSSPISWAATASYGIAFDISNGVEIFIEPQLQYRFNRSYDVPNAWTDHRWLLAIPIGFRFNM